MRSRPLLALLLLAVLGPLCSVASAQEATVNVGAAVHLRAEPGGVVEVPGVGRFRGAVEVRRSGGGLAVINHVDLEEYVMGIREVPGMWPIEALKAQAVAARTYALWEKQQGRHAPSGFDVCPTTSCQVYQGVDAEEGERGARWVEAVRATAGQVLLYEGRPALTRYHASSGGRTLPNHVVYGSGPRPYLMGTDDPDDAVAPLHRWTVDFSREALEALLRTELTFEGPMVDFQAPEGSRTAVVVTETTQIPIDLGRLRTIANERAPRMFPGVHPGPRSDGQRLPSTLPSSRFQVEVNETGVRFNGRGWGHGVGMSQWGAMGRASRGQTYHQILGAYYGGLQPQPWTGEPTMRVGMASGLAQVALSTAGLLTVSSGDQTLWSQMAGSWSVRPGPGDTLLVSGPPQPTPVPVVEEPPVPLVVEQASASAPLTPAAAPARGGDLPLISLATLLLALAVVAAAPGTGLRS